MKISWTPLQQEALAFAIARHYHSKQLDKMGRPYFEHCLAVASKFTNPVDRATAVMHDLVEDTPVTLEKLSSFGIFDTKILEALNLLTHKEHHTYQEYVIRLSINPLARRVKLADLAHNLGRLPALEAAQGLKPHLRNRYSWAIEYLNNI